MPQQLTGQRTASHTIDIPLRDHCPHAQKDHRIIPASPLTEPCEDRRVSVSARGTVFALQYSGLPRNTSGQVNRAFDTDCRIVQHATLAPACEMPTFDFASSPGGYKPLTSSVDHQSTCHHTCPLASCVSSSSLDSIAAFVSVCVHSTPARNPTSLSRTPSLAFRPAFAPT